jgi:hypothetical protein
MTKGVYVENLTEEPAESAVAVTSILQRGARNRHIGATSMNKESSRSHTVFTVIIQTKSTSGGLTKVKTSRLNLVDLAGSERQKAAQTEGQALKEASQINKSLSAIGNVSHSHSPPEANVTLRMQVIMALSDISAGRARHVCPPPLARAAFARETLKHSTRFTTATAVSHSYSKTRLVATAELPSSQTFRQVCCRRVWARCFCF